MIKLTREHAALYGELQNNRGGKDYINTLKKIVDFEVDNNIKTDCCGMYYGIADCDVCKEDIKKLKFWGKNTDK